MKSLLIVGDLQVLDQPQVDAHPHAGEQVQRLFAADRLGRAENAVGPADAVVQVLAAFLDQERPGLPLVVDDHRDRLRRLA